MGFFNLTQEPVKRASRQISTDYLHKMECKACPLNCSDSAKTPKMEPVGASKKCSVYFLGTAPDKEDDKCGAPFSGSTNKYASQYIPLALKNKVRFNNVIRTHGVSKSVDVPMEACRPSVVKDIEEAQPKLIVAFGSVALKWLIGHTSTHLWAGKYAPVRVGSHTCWAFFLPDIALTLATRRFTPRRRNEFASDAEHAFALRLRNALAGVDDLPEPVIHTAEDALRDLQIFDGSSSKHKAQVLGLLQDLHDCKLVGWDIETNGLRPYREGAKVLTMGFSSPEVSFAFALDHSQSQFDDEDKREILKAVRKVLKSDARKLVHNLAFEMEWLAETYGWKDLLHTQKWGCSQAQAYILDERDLHVLSLDFLCQQHFGLRLKQISNLDRKNLDGCDLQAVLRYNAMDAKYHRILFTHQRKLLEQQDLLGVYKQHMHRIPTMVLTQLKGIPVSQKVVRRFDELYLGQLEQLQQELSELKSVRKFKKQFGRPFVPSSNQDVKIILNDFMGKDTASVDENALRLVGGPFAEKLLQYRKVSKLHSTYVLPVKQGSPILWPDGLLHPSINTMSTTTWRTSSKDPNEQNWPKRKNKEIRSQIRPKAGQLVFSFDYGQIQARNVGMESLDKALVRSFWDRYDIHEDWVWRIVKRYPRWIAEGPKALKDKQLFKLYRNRAKNEMVFPSFFGARYRKIAKSLRIPEEIAQALHDEFWEMFPSILKWQEGLKETYKTTGYVTGHSGFRRRAPISPNELINAPIQADEALIVCDAMYRLSKLDYDQLQASMEIHDDLTFIWDKEKADENAEKVIDAMLNVPFKWARVVPIVVEMAVGRDWASCADVEAFSSDTWKGGVPDWRKVL